MHSTTKQNPQDDEIKAQFGSTSTNQKAIESNLPSSSVEHTTSPPSHGDGWKSEYLHGNFHVGDGKEFLQSACMKKSQSLGNILDKDRGFSAGDATDDDDGFDLQFSFRYFHEKSMERIHDSLDRNPYNDSNNRGKLGINFDNQHKETDLVESSDMTPDHICCDSLFSIEALRQFDSSQQADVDEQSTYVLADSMCLSSDSHHVLERSYSAINFKGDNVNSTDNDEIHKTRRRSRSFGNLHSLDKEVAEFNDGDEVLSSEMTRIGQRAALDSYNLPQDSDEDRKGSLSLVDSGEECPLSERSGGLIEGQEADGKYWAKQSDCDDETAIARHQFHDNIGKEPDTDDEKIENLQLEYPIKNFEDLNPKEFNIRRIEKWISQIDIANGSIVEEPGESSYSLPTQGREAEASATIVKPDAKSNPGMEIAYNYISSLAATSSSAQMIKLGLVAIPSLSAFTSLRVLNLSGNSIVRITAGSLPRGLHMLNLSKNNIPVIEGLRDLTHLRILDLSYNRIVRIGHGLASCSSLKELYLAGNKISEVEGLHRLLKLNILDLRGNKISTAKGLGQLAANFGSLHAINLEGNPAQRNVGDEYLKKYLLSLLPNLVYYNKHAIKSSGTKEISSDRPSRSVSRTELKLPRRGSHGSGLHKPALNQARTKQSRSRHVESHHVRLPPTVSKPATHLPEVEKKPVSLQPGSSIRRSRSEGCFT